MVEVEPAMSASDSPEECIPFLEQRIPTSLAPRSSKTQDLGMEDVTKDMVQEVPCSWKVRAKPHLGQSSASATQKQASCTRGQVGREGGRKGGKGV